jgi:hypothetical protein
VIAQNDDGADEAENYMKDVVWRSAAGQAFVSRNDESENPDQDQHGSENCQGEKVQVIENHRGDPSESSFAYGFECAESGKAWMNIQI